MVFSGVVNKSTPPPPPPLSQMKNQFLKRMDYDTLDNQALFLQTNDFNIAFTFTWMMV